MIDKKERIYKLLNDQLSQITKVLPNYMNINSTNIIGDNLENPNIIEVIIKEDGKKEYNKNGKLQEKYKVNSVMPSVPGFKKNLEEVMIDLCVRKMKGEI